MGRLKPLGFREIKRRLVSAGFEEISQRGSHVKFARLAGWHGYSDRAPTERGPCRDASKHPQPGSDRSRRPGQTVNGRSSSYRGWGSNQASGSGTAGRLRIGLEHSLRDRALRVFRASNTDDYFYRERLAARGKPKKPPLTCVRGSVPYRAATARERFCHSLPVRQYSR